MGNLQGFNANEHFNEERGEWKPIPVGEVLLCALQESKWKDTKDGKGRSSLRQGFWSFRNLGSSFDVFIEKNTQPW